MWIFTDICMDVYIHTYMLCPLQLDAMHTESGFSFQSPVTSVSRALGCKAELMQMCMIRNTVLCVVHKAASLPLVHL